MITLRTFRRRIGVGGIAIGWFMMTGAGAFGQVVDATFDASKASWAPRLEVPAIDYSNPKVVQAGCEKSAMLASSQVVEVDIEHATAQIEYVACILDWKGGFNNLFIKVQDNDADGDFDFLGFYRGNNDTSGWPGMTGGTQYVFLDPTEEFTSGHVTVMHDGMGNVTIELTNLNGGVSEVTHSRGGWSPLNGAATGVGFYSGVATADNWRAISGGNPICDLASDDYNRVDGPLGPDWITHNGSLFISSNQAGGSGLALATYIGGCDGGIQSVEADVGVVGTNNGYCALVLDSDAVNNLYIKVQQSSGSGQFDSIGFYSDVNSGGWPGITGGGSFFTIDLADRFSTAHMKVILDAAGNVRLLFYNRDTGGGVLEYQRGGWTLRNGHGAGIGGWNGNNIIDNFALNGQALCDAFDRGDGTIGDNWRTDEGSDELVAQAARPGFADSITRSLYVGSCGGSCPADMDGNGVVNVDDLLDLLAAWGDCF